MILAVELHRKHCTICFHAWAITIHICVSLFHYFIIILPIFFRLMLKFDLASSASYALKFYTLIDF